MIRHLGSAFGLILLPLVLSCASSQVLVEKDRVDLRGVIRDREGVGIEGISVSITLAERGVYSAVAGARTDENGAFHLRTRPGTYTTILDARDLRVPTVFLDSTNLRPPTARLDFKYGGFKVVGHLVGPGGKPIRNGVLEVMGNSPDYRHGLNLGAKLKRGRYLLYLPRGSYYFTTKPYPTYLPGTEGPPEIAIAADTTIDFSAEGNLIRGRVTVGGSSWSRANVSVRGSRWPGEGQISANSSTSSDGRYRLYLPDGHYTLFVGQDASASQVFPRLSNHEVTGPETLDIDFPAVQWTGTVRDSLTGNFAESVRVEAQDTRSSLSAVSTSGKNGRFRLLLEPGVTYRLSVSRTKPQIFPDPKWIRANRDSTFDLLVQPAGPPPE